MRNTQREIHLEHFDRNMWKFAEEQAVLLLKQYKLTPEEMIEQYTGKRPAVAQMKDAVDAIYLFNRQQATKNGFSAY
jgi:hypothetical protein